MTSPTVPLRKICKFISGGTPSRKNSAYFKGTMPWITGADITDNVFYKAREHITDEAIRQSATSIVPKGNLLLVTRTGVGKVAVAGVDVCISQDFTGLQLNHDKVDRWYLFYFLRSQKESLTSQQRGATIQGITRDVVENIQIPLPPLPEQKRIAAQLAQADRLRQLRRNASQLGESYLQSAFLAMFGDPIQNSRKWKVKPLQEIIDPQRPITYGILMPGKDIPDGIPYIRVVDIADHKIKINQVRRTTKEIATQYKRSTLQTNDLLMSIRGHVGRLAKVPKELDGANITQDTARFYPKHEVCNVDYLFGCLLTNEMQAWMAERVRGVAVQGINLGDLKIMPIPLPPLPEQERFAQIVARYERLRSQMRESTRQAELLFQGLLRESFG